MLDPVAHDRQTALTQREKCAARARRPSLGLRPCFVRLAPAHSHPDCRCCLTLIGARHSISLQRRLAALHHLFSPHVAVGSKPAPLQHSDVSLLPVRTWSTRGVSVGQAAPFCLAGCSTIVLRGGSPVGSCRLSSACHVGPT